MGRRPNLVLLQHFERGAKLNDNSNRYKYVCKACGENFPKGRSETLVSHLTKRCPAITEADRMSACLALHGLNGGAQNQPSKFDPTVTHTGPNSGPHGPNAGSVPSSSNEHAATSDQGAMWTPLETLAEVSRQIEANEKHDDHPPSSHDNTVDLATTATTAIAAPNTLAASATAFDGTDNLVFDGAHLHFDGEAKRGNAGMLQSAPMSPATTQAWAGAEPFGYSCALTAQTTDNAASKEQSASIPQHELTDEERLQNLLQSASSTSQSAVSVAAAATARLNPHLLDPQLLTDDVLPEPLGAESVNHDPLVSAPMTQEHVVQEPLAQEHAPTNSTSDEVMIDLTQDRPPMTPPAAHTTPQRNSSNGNESVSPWAGMTYMPDDIHAPAAVNDHGQQLLGTLNKGGFRMDTSLGPNGPRHRHSRARFATDRRKEVQEVRRIGACIRCRILRKTCSKGTPCDTCRKVLSPRVWRTGCVRTKLSEFIDLYTAGVQIVMSQKRVNNLKGSHALSNKGVIIEAAHFPETGHKVIFQVLQGVSIERRQSNPESPETVVLLDNDNEDVPAKVENYMRQILPELIRREPSPHIRVTLENANQIAQDTNDELLKRSLELWGIVEIMDRERGWTMLAKDAKEDAEDFWLKDETGNEAYTNICMQLTAGAERKAAVASKNLLNSIQRSLQDGKTKLGFPMFLTVMLFLNCVEKTTWAFKAWDEENLRPQWPLEKPPSNYTNQGHGLCDLLRMLLVIRHILPKTSEGDPDAPIRTDETDPVIQKFYQDLNISTTYLHMRHKQNNFQPTDSRSLEFMFCAPLLLPPPA